MVYKLCKVILSKLMGSSRSIMVKIYSSHMTGATGDSQTHQDQSFHKKCIFDHLCILKNDNWIFPIFPHPAQAFRTAWWTLFVPRLRGWGRNSGFLSKWCSVWKLGACTHIGSVALIDQFISSI